MFFFVMIRKVRHAEFWTYVLALKGHQWALEIHVWGNPCLEATGVSLYLIGSCPKAADSSAQDDAWRTVCMNPYNYSCCRDSSILLYGWNNMLVMVGGGVGRLCDLTWASHFATVRRYARRGMQSELELLSLLSNPYFSPKMLYASPIPCVSSWSLLL